MFDYDKVELANMNRLEYFIDNSFYSILYLTTGLIFNSISNNIHFASCILTFKNKINHYCLILQI